MNGLEEYEFHCHSDQPERPTSKKSAIRILWFAAALSLFFMIAEVVGGIIAQSLAIVTDAAHLLTDFASMLISLFALYISTRPASQRMCFGWHRAEVLGAFISVCMIWVITGILVYMAIQRITSGEYDIDATVMAATAALGVIVNLIMAVVLRYGGNTHSHLGHSAHQHDRAQADSNQHRQNNINVRAAMVHVIGDMLQSVGVLIASLIIYHDKAWSIADPICTLIFSLIVLCTTFYIVRDAVVVLLEGRPSNVDFRSVFYSLERIDGVQKVHNLRIWCLSMEKIAISVHLEIVPGANAQQILRWTTQMLRNEYKVHESTVQIEGYQPNKQDCNLCVPPI